MPNSGGSETYCAEHATMLHTSVHGFVIAWPIPCIGFHDIYFSISQIAVGLIMWFNDVDGTLESIFWSATGLYGPPAPESTNCHGAVGESLVPIHIWRLSLAVHIFSGHIEMLPLSRSLVI